MDYKSKSEIQLRHENIAQKRSDITPKIEIMEDIEPSQARKEYVMIQYFLTGSISRAATACKGQLKGGGVTPDEIKQYLAETSRDEIANYRRKAYEQIIDKQVAIVKTLQDAEFKKVYEILKNSQGTLDQVKVSDLAAAFKTNYQVLEFMQVFCANKDQITIQEVNVDADAIRKLEDMQ